MANRPSPLGFDEIRDAVRRAPPLPSLGHLQETLRILTEAEEVSVSRLADRVRLDPALTVRLLRHVRSMGFGQGGALRLEDAILMVVARTLRELALLSPVVADMRRLAGPETPGIAGFWLHSASVAVLTRFLLGASRGSDDDLDYIAGLVHDIGWLVIRSVFPAHYAVLEVLLTRRSPMPAEHLEQSVLGATHSMVGAWYLAGQEADELLVRSALLHGMPEGAGRHAKALAAVQIADQFAAQQGGGFFADPPANAIGAWREASGWRLLFPDGREIECEIAKDRLEKNAPRLLGLAGVIS